MVGCNSCQTKQRQDISKKTSTLNIQPISNFDASNNLTDCVINTVDLIIDNYSLQKYVTNLKYTFIQECLIKNKYIVLSTPSTIVLEIPINKIKINIEIDLPIEAQTVINIITHAFKISEVEVKSCIYSFSEHAKELLKGNVKEYLLAKKKGDKCLSKQYKNNIIHIYEKECPKENEKHGTVTVVIPQNVVQLISKMNYFLSIGKFFIPSNVTLILPEYVTNWVQLNMWYRYILDNKLIKNSLTSSDLASNMTVKYEDGDDVKLFKSQGQMLAYDFLKYLKNQTELNKNKTRFPTLGSINPQLVLNSFSILPSVQKCEKII